MIVVDLTMVEKELRKVPKHIRDKLYLWSEQIRFEGLRCVRRTPSWHDEPLKGKRKGQRSIRLSKSYRAIYKVNEVENITVIVIELSKHRY